MVGLAIGFTYSYFTTELSKGNEHKIHEAFVALSITLISYGLSEILNSYGFISVFFDGLFAHCHSKNKENMINPSFGFITNIENLISFFDAIFGGSIIAGIFDFATIEMMLF